MILPHSGTFMWKAKRMAIHSRATNQAKAQQECSRVHVMREGYLRGSHTAIYLQRREHSLLKEDIKLFLFLYTVKNGSAHI